MSWTAIFALGPISNLIRAVGINPKKPLELKGNASIGIPGSDVNAWGISVMDTRFKIGDHVYVEYVTKKQRYRSAMTEIIGHTKNLPIVLTPALFKHLENPAYRTIPVTVKRRTA